jgi:hypothetical protein
MVGGGQFELRSDHHAHDLMATTKDPNARFEPGVLKSLSAFAHHCDPPPPKHLVPVFPAVNSTGCASAGTFHPITCCQRWALAVILARRAM